jgi:hypothetical protein
VAKGRASAYLAAMKAICFLRPSAPALTALLMATAIGITAAQAEDRSRSPSYSIMAPEPGTPASRSKATGQRQTTTHETRSKSAKPSRARAKLLAGKKRKVVRGSSGSVLPTPLPRTKLIPPVTARIRPVRPLPQDPSPTIVPGLPPIPNLPPATRGRETFQDRASRCAHQAGVYGVPNEQRSVYMGACTM